MDLQLKDKVVLISGGAKGIGEAITRGCAREGAIPVFIDKDAEAGQKLAAELRDARARCEFICADVLPAENCRAAVEQTIERFGGSMCSSTMWGRTTTLDSRREALRNL